MMSIFISLCTDNAKELRLYMIGANPDLLNLPLAMITLGMDIDDVTDLCVQYIVPIMHELNSVNKIVEDDKNTVESILKSHLDKAKKEGNADLANTYNSLLKIYDTAQEMKIIAGQFKINQGTSVKPIETQ